MAESRSDMLSDMVEELDDASIIRRINRLNSYLTSISGRPDLLVTLDADVGPRSPKRQKSVDLNDRGSGSNSLERRRQFFTTGAESYTSAIRRARKGSQELKELDVERICQMGSEVRQALTNLQNELDLLHIAKKRMCDLSVAESKRHMEAEMKAVAAADRARFEAEKAQVESAARDEAKACIICKEKPHDMLIFPCLHAHCCSDCLEKQKAASNNCPTCRTTMSGTLRYLL